ncbi:MAG: M48 family metallopeptidase [Chlamydiia bacterium]|nr:M48 family metallopeptidase [Chlamydiia bacterium]
MKWLCLFLMIASVCFGSECQMPPVAVPSPTPEAVSFYHSGNTLFMIQIIWNLAIPALILFTGLSAKLWNLSEWIAKRWLWKTALFTLFFLILVILLSLPLDFYASYMRPHLYGLSNQTLGRFFSHYVINQGITLLSGVILVWILYGIIRKSPKRWWLYFGLLNFPLAVFIVLIQPIWIAPLFNHFGPMKDKALEQKILDLAQRAGIEGGRVYEVDMSADTKAINAYVTGIGATKRIVIWDTAIKNLSEKELLFVVGHEMGHYVLHHLWWGILFYTLISLVTLFLVHLFARLFIKWWHQRMGFQELSDIASLPLILLLYTFFSFLTSPASNLISQRIEHNADTFGLELTELNHAAATGFVKLQISNLGYPWPGLLYLLFRTGHPPIGARITYFNTYKPYCEGKPLKYGQFIDEM